jgi:DNA-binding transcriptional LysR family regulator
MVASMQADEGLRWDDVRLFLALHRARSLSGAGARVGLDASTLSRRLAALEERLAARLFDRTRDGLVATGAAELLFPAAEEMESAHARFARDASGFEREVEGVVRLSVPPGIADAFVAPGLARLRKKHPGIRIDLDASVRLLDLTRREVDLALRTIRPQSGELVMQKVSASRWTPMVASTKAQKGTRFERWDDVDWIAWGDDLAGIPPARWLAKHAPKAVPVLRTSHMATQVAAVEAGLGVALLPLAYTRVSAVAPLRVAKSLDASASDLPINETWLVGHRALRGVPRIAAVWDFLVDELRAVERPETMPRAT